MTVKGHPAFFNDLGPTGKYPNGTKGPHDGGELRVGIAADSDGLVHINFGTEVDWIAMRPEQAIEFAKTILAKAGAKRIEITL